MDNAEKKLPVRNLERISEKKFGSYDAAKQHQQKIVSADGQAPAKIKIFARYDGTFDVVAYKKIQSAAAKQVEKDIDLAVRSCVNPTINEMKAIKVLHGQKSKDRKKDPRKK